MKQQVRLVALLALVMLPMGVMGQVTYNGNGNGGFGSPLGGGSLQISDDGTTISFVFTRGAGNFNDGLVIYFDSESGGHTSTTNFTDEGDYLRKAVSGRDEGVNAIINFPNGFTADFGLGVHVNTFDFAGLFNLNESSAHGYVDTGNLVGTPAPSDATFSFSIEKSEIGISGDVRFRFVATYLNADGAGGPFRSNEAIGAGFGGSNPGTATVSMTSYWEYPVSNEITNTKTTSITNAAGWRLLASPVSTTYADIVAEGWTQGSTGADVTNGTANVRTYTTAGGFANVADLGATVPAGQGFLYYHFNDDNFDGTPNASATTFSVTGTENASGTTYTPAWASGTQYGLAGNPFATTIDWDLVGKAEGVQNSVWVYDRNISNYISWNGTTGDLTNGLIAPFQGFFYEYTSASSTVTFETADKSSGATFYRKDVKPFVVALEGASGDFRSTAYLEFEENGDLGKGPKDALAFVSLSPDHLTLATISDAKAYSINHLPLLRDVVELPLDVQFTQGGLVELSVKDLNLPTGWSVSLRDTETGVVRDLTSDFRTSVQLPALKAAPRNPLDLNGQPVMIAASTAPRFTLIIDPASSTSTKDDGRGTMDDFRLEQNYPNPFNPSTQIRFTLRTSNLARLTVYDVLGREVAVLVNETLPAGAHSVTFDASNLTSGVYLYKLEAGGMSMTKRMTLVK